jgi:hypothetical protein
MTNPADPNTSMKAVLTVLRILLGILVGLAGGIFLLNAAYQPLNINFRFADGGPFMLVSLLIGSVMVWVAWRLVRGRRVHLPAG